MLEQFLAILLTSHHLGGNGLIFEKKSIFTKGIYPGTRLGLQRISSEKSPSHYCPGDLGIIPKLSKNLSM